MDLTKITEDAFMCQPGAYTPSSEIIGAFADGEGAFSTCIGPAVWDLGDGYFIHFATSPGGGAVFNDDTVATFNGDLVGYYMGEGLAVDDAHSGTGKRLGPAMILAATVARPLPSHRLVTPQGDSALRRAWRLANKLENRPWTIPSWIPHIP